MSCGVRATEVGYLTWANAPSTGFGVLTGFLHYGAGQVHEVWPYSLALVLTGFLQKIFVARRFGCGNFGACKCLRLSHSVC